MAALHKLTDKGIQAAEPGKYSDGAGLWLHKRTDGGAQWVLRVTVHGKRREMGLGRYSSGGKDGVSLRAARTEAAKWRDVAATGLDPIRERQKRAREALRNLHILKDVASDAFEARKAELKGDGKAGRWFTPLELHVLPKLGQIPVSEIDQTDIRDALAPIWHTKASTAEKAIHRLAIVMRHAAALGLDVDLQATQKARALLGKQRHIVQHIPAMAWQDVPGFYESLSEGTVTHLAMRLLILTGARSATIRNLHLDQIDGSVWTIPAEAMKGRKGATAEFRVPLSHDAMQIIKEAKAHERGGFLFPNVRKGVISDMTLSRMMARRGLEERPHGFRSSLRNWLAECTDAPHEVAETCLGHIVDSKVVRSYRRTDFLEQRQALLERWADHVTGGVGQVVRLAK